MRDENPLRIGELAERLELNPRTLRYWEQIGITPAPDRTDGGYRTYGPDDEHRLRFIRDARHLGFTLGEIKEILALRDQGQAPCQYVTALLRRRIFRDRPDDRRAGTPQDGALPARAAQPQPPSLPTTHRVLPHPRKPAGRLTHLGTRTSVANYTGGDLPPRQPPGVGGS